MKSHKKAVVFDLDGTIIDTIADIAAAVNRALAFYGYPPRTVTEIQSFLGNGSLVLMRRALPNGGSVELCMKIRSRFREEYRSDMFSLTKPYDGIKELFEELSSKGIKTAVITNKDDNCAVPMIEYFFGTAVDICRGIRKDGERKPSPDVTLSVLAELGVTPEETLFVGDGMADLNVSKNCGIDFIPIGYGYTAPERLFAECGTEPVPDVASLCRKIKQYLAE